MREPVPWTTDPETMVRMIADRDRVIIHQYRQSDKLLTALRAMHTLTGQCECDGYGESGYDPTNLCPTRLYIDHWDATQ